MNVTSSPSSAIVTHLSRVVIVQSSHEFSSKFKIRSAPVVAGLRNLAAFAAVSQTAIRDIVSFGSLFLAQVTHVLMQGRRKPRRPAVLSYYTLITAMALLLLSHSHSLSQSVLCATVPWKVV